MLFVNNADNGLNPYLLENKIKDLLNLLLPDSTLS